MYPRQYAPERLVTLMATVPSAVCAAQAPPNTSTQTLLSGEYCNLTVCVLMSVSSIVQYNSARLNTLTPTCRATFSVAALAVMLSPLCSVTTHHGLLPQ